MKAKYTFEIMDLEDGLVAVPVGNGADKFHGVLKVNETAAMILKLLAHDITEEGIVDALLKEYNGDKETILHYVHRFINQMDEEGVLDRE